MLMRSAPGIAATSRRSMQRFRPLQRSTASGALDDALGNQSSPIPAEPEVTVTGRRWALLGLVLIMVVVVAALIL